MATAALNRYTPEEYLALERNAEFRSEYIDGRIVAMTGGSIPHNYIGGNIYAGLLARFSSRPCHVFFADVKVRFGRGTDYTYPDVMALCGAPGYGDEHSDILTNPALIVEVLSRSTEPYDRGDKFKGYKAIDSLREYLLVSQDEVKVEHFIREGDFWPSRVVTDLDATVELRSVGCTLPMREIYRRTRFVPEDMVEESA
ncbi:MAG TPA: Uma2 family endonuclease [Longimicrobium sp.]|jgi:Uma2 family endonuclease|uniref:Uma2 family endonuclease n=1 Tax=Longimicrobium sp. TaxID=2029185 RepID=UPI002EDA9CD9